MAKPQSTFRIMAFLYKFTTQMCYFVKYALKNIQYLKIIIPNWQGCGM